MTVFDTTGLQNWPVPAEMDSAAADLSTKAGEFKDGVEDCENEWKGLQAHFSMDDSAATDRVLNFYDLVTAHGDVVKASAEKTEDVIGEFAEDVRDLEVRRTTAFDRIDEHNRRVGDGDEPTACTPSPRSRSTSIPWSVTWSRRRRTAPPSSRPSPSTPWWTRG